MQIRLRLLMSTAVLAAMTATAFGQGFGYPEAPRYTVSNAAQYWYSPGWVQRVRTGHAGFMATNGCDNKPICSLCDYSRPRVCGCNCGPGDLLTGLVGWLSVRNPLGCAAQKCSTQKGCTQKGATQKFAAQKCAPRKCAPQKCTVQKCAPRRCVPQKAAIQKCATQKSGKSCGCAPKFRSCGPSLIDTLASRISQIDILGRADCCHSKSACEPKIAVKSSPVQKSASPVQKSDCGCNGAPKVLPVPTWEPGDDAPAGEGLPQQADPSEPPAPIIEGDSVGTGVPSMEPYEGSRGAWRRIRVPRAGVPRLLPSARDGRDVSRISYEQVVEIPSTGKSDESTAPRKLDVFEAATKVVPLHKQAPVAGGPRNPLRP